MFDLCSVCAVPARSNAKLHACDNCQKLYHPNCGKFSNVAFGDNKTGRACHICIVTALPTSDNRTRLRRSNSLSSARDVSNNAKHTTAASTVTTTVPATASVSTSSAATTTAAKLSQLDPMQLILAEISNLKLSIDTRFDTLSSQIQALDVPNLVARIDSTESGLTEVKSEVQELKNELAVFQREVRSIASGVTPDQPQNTAMLERISVLEKKNAELSRNLEKVSSQKRHFNSTELVIGGLSVPPGADPRKLVAAVLGLVHKEFDAREIVSTRLLVSKAMVSDAVRGTASSNPANTGVSESIPPITLEALPSTSSAAAPPRPPSILVTLKSRALLLAIIDDKIKMGKLHTSALASVLPDDVDLNLITPYHININEFLPKDVYLMYRKVYQAARQPNSGFVSFVRSGNIYVRRKKGDVATLINTAADLNRFLGS